MTWSADMAVSAVESALVDFGVAVAEASRDTVPATPMPRLPKGFAEWAIVPSATYREESPWGIGSDARSDPRLRSRGQLPNSPPAQYHWRPGYPSGRDEAKWAFVLAHLCGFKPAKVARLVARIRADAAWLRRSAEARRKMAAEIVRQQAAAADMISATGVAVKL